MLLSKIWRALESDSYVSVSMRNLEELSEKEPGLFIEAHQVQPAGKPQSQTDAGKSSAPLPNEVEPAPELPESKIDVEALTEDAYQKGVAAGEKEVEEKLAQATKTLTEAAKNSALRANP